MSSKITWKPNLSREKSKTITALSKQIASYYQSKKNAIQRMWIVHDHIQNKYGLQLEL